MNIPVIVTMIIGAYLLGSIPFGLILARIFLSVDLRKIGSGNIGATNARRAGGWKFGLIVLFCDLSKGAIPAAIGLSAFGKGTAASEIIVTIVAVSALVGHIFPVYLKFKSGGKGVATTAGCFLVLSPPSFIIALGLFIGTIALFKRVSGGSLTAAAALPLSVYFLENSTIMAFGALIITILVFLRHRGNIARLLAGTEPPL